MKNKGITIISLIVTIVVLLILAGITIGTLAGENGIIGSSKTAKEQSEIANEKEIIEQATIEAMGKEKYGNISKENLELAMNQKAGEGKTNINDAGGCLEILFVESNRVYQVDNEGNIKEYQLTEQDPYPGDITKDRNGNVLEGNEESPYEIWCIEDLVEFSKDYDNYKNAYIKLGRTLNFKSMLSYVNSSSKEYGDINQDGVVEALIEEMQKGIGFTPILEFRGVLDGQNYEINNLYIYNTLDVGLFSYASGANLLGLTISGNITSLEGNAGALVGHANGSYIENCYNRAKVLSKNQSAGGMVGYSDSTMGTTKISNCGNSGEIISEGTLREGGSDYKTGCAGGITGSRVDEIENCYNKGNVISGYSAGGIMGYKYSSFKIINCFNEGNIEGKVYAGGILGENKSGTGEIYNCYNKGDIKSDEYAGGILGMVYYNTKASIYHCCHIGKVRSDKNFGGIVGRSSAGTGSYKDYMPEIVNNYSVPSNLKGIGNFDSSEVIQVESISEEIINVLNDYIVKENKSDWRKWKLTAEKSIEFET